MRVEYILQHGWGFDARVWNSWLGSLSYLSPATIFHLGERGYFGGLPFTPRFLDSSSLKVAVTHSLGLHFLTKEVLAKADALFILAGFLNFHPEDQLSHRRSKRVVKAMKEKLQTEPHTVLSDFFQSCYSNENQSFKFPLAAVPEGEEINCQRLLADLDTLDTSDLLGAIDVVTDDAAVFLLHGTGDRIVNADKTLELAMVMPKAKVLLVENGSHALPTMQITLCLETIKEALSRELEAQYAKLSP